MGTTLKELAASGDLASRGAAALIETGHADSTPLKELTPGGVTRTLVEAFAREPRRCTSGSASSAKARRSPYLWSSA